MSSKNNKKDKKLEEDSSAPLQGPGDHLQSARIKQGLSLEEVANKMHLSNAILKSIEKNDFDDITAPIFVKGYLRAYARIVDLDEDKTIKQYLDFDIDEDPPIMSTANTTPQINSRDGRVKWVTFLVISLIILLTVSWWWTQDDNKSSAISLETETIEEATVDNAPTEKTSENANEAEISTAVTDIKTVDEQITQIESQSGIIENQSSTAEMSQLESEKSSNQQVQFQAGEVAQNSDQASSTSIDSEADSAVMAAITKTIEEAKNNQTELSTESEAETNSAGQTVSGNISSETAPTGSDQLGLIVNADTWAEIKDATGHQLIYDLLRVGEKLKLTGQAPFSVFFGNGYGIDLTLNERLFDINGNIRSNNTVRMNIPASE